MLAFSTLIAVYQYSLCDYTGSLFPDVLTFISSVFSMTFNFYKLSFAEYIEGIQNGPNMFQIRVEDGSPGTKLKFLALYYLDLFFFIFKILLQYVL